MDEIPGGDFPPASHGTATTVVCGVPTAEIGLDDGLTALRQLGLITQA